MFPRAKRVSREDFPKILTSRRRISSAHFSATLADTPKGYAAVVAKRVVATSVGRHALKRRILSVLQTITPLPAPGIIVFAKAGAQTLTFKEASDEMNEMLRTRESKR